MKFLEIKIPNNDIKLAVFGDCHEHPYQVQELIKQINPNRDSVLLASVGDYSDKGYGRNALNEICTSLIELQKQSAFYGTVGNHEAKRLKKEKRPYDKTFEWLASLPTVLSFIYPNGSRYTVLHGGVTSRMTWEDLKQGNSEVLYIRDLDEDGNFIPLQWVDEDGKKVLKPKKLGGKSFHETYDGRFGFLIAGHAPHDTSLYYRYSCNLDSGIFRTGKLTCAIFNSQGFEKEIVIDGPAFYAGKEDNF